MPGVAGARVSVLRCRPMRRLLPSAAVLCLVALACGKLRPEPTPPPPAPWTPGLSLRLDRTSSARGLLDLRGLIHAHSIYSHDACDGAPEDGGVYDQSCLQDFRRDFCRAQHDFAFLTDHAGSFARNEFPDVLLFRPDAGDALVTHGAGPTANWLACPEGPAPLVMAGTETGTMPVGLESHAADRDVYGHVDAPTLDTLHAQGAVALVAHTEGWTVEQLTSLPLDGFEMFNLHRNAFQNAGVLAELVLGHVEKGDFEGMPQPDAFFTALNLEDDTYRARWGTVLARGAHRVTTMGTDCHRNSFPQLLQDGERIDSYRRMMMAFSNHLLVTPQADGHWDDRDLKAALKGGRLYGVFEFLGYAQGFDFVAREAGQVREMGATVSLARGVTLEATVPSVLRLDPAAEAPKVVLQLLRAREDGWDLVASTTTGPLAITPTEPGAYRVEVRMTPLHLKGVVGTRQQYARVERPWVYSNAIYVEP